MNNNARIGIVVALLVVVGVVMAVKQRDKETGPAQEQPPAQTTLESQPAAMQPAEAPAAKKALPRLVDLGAGKCIPCKKMAPILEELKKEFAGRLEVEFIDVWEHPDAAKPYLIKLIPTQIFFDPSGRELFRHEGFFSREDILGKWKELGVDLQSGTASGAKAEGA